MLKALLFSLMNLALAAMAMAQNLVPNPSFEDTIHCLGWPPPQVEAMYWHTANTATPDIWNCDLDAACGFHLMDADDPGIQQQGYQYAFDGDRFAGGFQWYGPSSSNTRDYLSARLTQPLQSGDLYRVSLYCARPSGVNGAIDHIGVHFGSDSLHAPFPTTLPLVPQARLRISPPGYLVDTAWVEVVDTITAMGNEEWIIIGTFEDADDVDGIWLGWGSFPPAVYYYLDMVTVLPVTSEGMHALGQNRGTLTVRGQDIVWTGGLPLIELDVFDSLGRRVWTLVGSNEGRRYSIPSELPSGAYIAAGRSSTDRCYVRFIK